MTDDFTIDKKNTTIARVRGHIVVRVKGREEDLTWGVAAHGGGVVGHIEATIDAYDDLVKNLVDEIARVHAMYDAMEQTE